MEVLSSFNDSKGTGGVKPFLHQLIGAMELREELWIELVPLESDSAGSVEEASSGEREGRPMEAWKGFQGNTGRETSKV